MRTHTVDDDDLRRLIDELAEYVARDIKVRLSERDVKIAELQRQCEQLQKIVKDIPAGPAKSSQDFDPESVGSLIQQAVKSAIKEIPDPRDMIEQRIEADGPGWLDHIKQSIDDEIGKLPKPKDGKNADPELIRQMVADAVNKIPQPSDGKSVTVDDVRPIITLEIERQIEKIPKAKDGAPGKDGKDGRDGKDADPNLIGQIVTDAISHIPVPVDGKDGAPGRDATQIEIEPEIDENKTYPRGVYAMHRGGLWHSYEKTHRMRGWECAIEGIHNIEIGLKDEREIEVSVERSSGDPIRKSFPIPAMIYRGVFKPGGYHPGDTVTFGGSIWHCNYETDEKPGQSDAWTLSVKNLSIKRTVSGK